MERHAELALIDALVEQARDGEGAVAVVEAPAGIGKTSLLRAGVHGARGRGLRVFGASGSEMERDSPFGVVRQLLEPALLAAAPVDRDAWFEGAAGFARPVFVATGSPDAAPAPVDPGHAVLHGLYWLLARLAARTPLVISVDDVHCADGPSVRFLAFLTRRLEGLPVLLLLAGRPGDETAWAESLEEALGGARACWIRPLGLSGPGVARVIEERLGEPPAIAFVTACRRVTRGNPFYLGELLAELAERGLQPVGENAASVGELAPGGAGRATLRATTRLPAGARELLEAVAILGDGAECELARRLAGLGRGVTADITHALVRSVILEPGPCLSFVYPIARAAFYEGLAPAERAARHAAAVGLLREHGASPERVASQLLLTAPGALAGTARALEHAAGEALRRGAPEIAVRCLRRVLDEPLDPARRVAVSLALGSAAAGAALPEAESLLRAALELAELAEDRADAAVALARLLTISGRSTAAVEVLAALSDDLAGHEAATAHRLDLELLTVADIDLSVRPEVSDRLQGQLVRVGGTAPRHEHLVLAHRAVDALRSGDSAASAADHAQAALAGDGLERAGMSTLLRPLLIYVLTSAERYDLARGHCDQMLERARAEGSAQLFVAGSVSSSLLHLRTGSLVDSEAEARQALDVAVLNAWQPLLILALIGLTDTMLDRTGPTDAALTFERVSLDLDAIDTAQAAAALFSRGRMRVAAGAGQQGCRDLLECGRRFGAWKMINPAVSPWRSEAAVVLASSGERERARDLAAEEVVLARRWGTPRPLGMALRARGLVETGESGLALLAESVAVLEHSGARLEHGRALIDLGAALRRAGRRTLSRDPLRRGVGFAQASGADLLAQRGRAELRAAGGRARTPLRTGVDALTPSEARIVEMAANGRSNPAIAQALFLTPKTIEMHLTSAYRKLGISSRLELAAALDLHAGRKDPGVAPVPGVSR